MDRHHGKIIIFGEYTVINNGYALALPMASVFGSLKIESSFIGTSSNQGIQQFSNFLKDLVLPFEVTLNLHQLRLDIQNGLYLDSNAKEGYGMGSSGILTASIFSKYYENKKFLTLEELRIVLASMESFFHGKSSGIDPLVAFFNCPLKMTQNGIELIDLLPQNILNNFYLMDTKIQRNTQSLVKWYKDNLHDPTFEKAMSEISESIPTIIDDFLSGLISSFEKKLKLLSLFQLEWWRPLIPNSIIDIWEKGLKNDQYYTKICGAGGGGYMIIYKKENLPETKLEISPIT